MCDQRSQIKYLGLLVILSTLFTACAGDETASSFVSLGSSLNNETGNDENNDSNDDTAIPLPLNVDLDNDGYANTANLPGWPAAVDCDDNDPLLNPGAADTVGDLTDKNCKIDRAFARVHFGGNYDVTLEMNSTGTGVFVTAKYSDLAGNAYTPTTVEYQKETLVDPSLVDIPDNQSGPDGCKTSQWCDPSDYHDQPFTDYHESKSWRYCFLNNQGNNWNSACIQPQVLGASSGIGNNTLGEGVGFLVQKLGPNTFRVHLVGAMGVPSNPLFWDYRVELMGE